MTVIYGQTPCLGKSYRQMNHCIEAVLTHTVDMLNPADSHKTVVVDTRTLHYKPQKQL